MTAAAHAPAELAKRFIQATGSKNLDGVKALMHDRAVFWTNISQEDLDRDTRMGMIAVEFKLFRTFAFAEPRISEFAGGFVVRARVDGSLHDGKTFEFPICIVGEVRDGLISRVEEYVDAAAVASIISAMGPAAQH